MELLIAPQSLPMTVNANGVAVWREEDVAEIPATCVYSGGLVAALRALDEGHLTSATVAIVRGCESQLTIEATGVKGEVRLIIRELYPPHLSATIELPVAELVTKLFLPKVTLSDRQAYEAMFSFLEELYERTHYDEIGALLGQIQMMSDGGSADPAMWHDWLRCVRQVLAKDGPV
jgi:hypothetical protein